MLLSDDFPSLPVIPIILKLCLKYCEEIYVCNDNPRKEDPYKIASMIALNNDFKIIKKYIELI